jgi:hypothetical protein
MKWLLSLTLFLWVQLAYAAGVPVYVAYYTTGTPYEEEAKLLRASLDLFRLEYEIQGVPSLGSWQKNTQFKAFFIQEMLAKYSDRPVVYLDADAIVRAYPILFDEINCDIAVHHYDNKRRNFKELLSGTVYFGTSSKAREIVEVWIETNRELPEQWDQKNLQLALDRVPDVSFVELPPSYCLIFDLMKDQGPAVIEHFQASRRFKQIINSN